MKNELINVREENGKILVSGRELHEGLGVKARYNDWIKNMIGYGFEDGTDYTKILVQCIRGQNQYDHVITLDMAKEISMIQRNEIGKKFRQYFIECEKKLMQIQPKLPTTYKEALLALVEEVENEGSLKELFFYKGTQSLCILFLIEDRCVLLA